MKQVSMSAPLRPNVGKGMSRRIWSARYGYLFLVPVFLVMGIFKYYPAATAIVMSFFDWNGHNYTVFIGFDNFVALWHDSVFLESLRNVGILMVTEILKTLTLPLLAAVLVCKLHSSRGREAYKILFVIPMVVPGMVIILMWKWIYNPTYGVLNQLISLLGGSGNQAWLGSADTALLSVILTGFPWIGGVAFLIYLGGLQAISEELYEAATIDGAGAWSRFIRIDLPLIAGQIRILIILAVIHAMNSFENILVLTNGGPGYTTMVPALHLYQQGFTYFKMGYASAIGTFLFVILFVLTIISFKFGKSDESNG